MKKLYKFPIGMLVSSHPCCKSPFMPGVGKIVGIVDRAPMPYICVHNDILYRFDEEEIYEYDPY